MRTKKALSPELRALCIIVERWRERNGGSGSRVPEEIWQDAVRVAKTEGLHATARATRLACERLKGRMTQDENGVENSTGVVPTVDRKAYRARGGDGRGQMWTVEAGGATAAGNAGSRFVAIDVPAARMASQMTIDVVSRHGDRMCIAVTGAVDVGSVLQTFWSGQSCCR